MRIRKILQRYVPSWDANVDAVTRNRGAKKGKPHLAGRGFQRRGGSAYRAPRGTSHSECYFRWAFAVKEIS